MRTLVQTLGLRGNPFEHYTAETEPDIASYAIRPPYLQAISDRVRGLTSFILFGDRGSGKSATRITVFNEIWKNAAADGNNTRNPFVVTLTDYSSIQDAFKKGALGERDLIALVAFVTVEQTLLYLSSLPDEDRNVFLEGLDQAERTLALALVRGFYLSVSEMDRDVSTSEALRLLNSAWTTKSAVWMSRRWDAVSKVLAATVSVLSKKTMGEAVDIAGPADALFKALTGEAPNAPRAVLSKLTEFVQMFGFSGLSVLVDKVDETPVTSNSAEATTKLVYPLLSHIQLLEIPSFSWVLFLWSKVKDHFSSDKFRVRLDKIAHTSIEWNADSLREMLEKRVGFFSEGRLQFKSLFEESVDVDSTFSSLIANAINSPRELIKLMDTLVREHDARGEEAPPLIDARSVEMGQDKYVVETIGGVYGEKFLQQVFRLGRTAFVNKDVQGAFKISDQAARAKIKNWEDIGLVRQSGTQAPAGDLGGQPAYRFIVADARVERIIDRKLVSTVGAEIEGGGSED